MKQRIQKVLANEGIASRRNIEQMVQQGRISVNGTVQTELPILVDPEFDKISIDDRRIKLSPTPTAGRLYFIMNKPTGVYSTNVAQGEQRRAIDLLPPHLPRLYPVGRLDAESRGLLLLTNDGELTNQLTHPRFGVAKTYRAVVDGYIAPEQTQTLIKGLWLANPKTGVGFKTGRSQIKLIKRSRQFSVLEITIREGRNRQVRRMLAKVGHKVRELTRIRFGPLVLGRLQPGEFRPLTSVELRQLKASAHDQGAPVASKNRTGVRTAGKHPRQSGQTEKQVGKGRGQQG
ncbi:MAG: rRNA pseudouridine synthase [Phycisphaerales bacterium]|nr:rRNA pseudouridine synthase [Phycisphaerales bacterium]